MAIERTGEGSDKGADKVSASDKVAEKEAIGDEKQNKQHKDVKADCMKDMHDGSLGGTPVPTKDQIEAFQLTDGDKTIASTRATSDGGSYYEGLKAVGEEDQANYTIDYINEKAKQRGFDEVKVAYRGDKPQLAQEFIRNETGGAAEIMTPEERKSGEPDAGERTAEAFGMYSHRGSEDDYMEYDAFKAAHKAFPQFDNHQNVRWEHIAAMVRNEQHYYMNVKEQNEEQLIKAGKGDEVGIGKSIGPAQIQIRNIERLIEKYPQLTDPKLGGIRKDHVLEDALKPDKAAWLATAYVADKIESNEAKGNPVTVRQLIQDYNPGGAKHHAHVMEQLEVILKKFYVGNEGQ